MGEFTVKKILARAAVAASGLMALLLAGGAFYKR